MLALSCDFRKDKKPFRLDESFLANINMFASPEELEGKGFKNIGHNLIVMSKDAYSYHEMYVFDSTKTISKYQLIFTDKTIMSSKEDYLETLKNRYKSILTSYVAQNNLSIKWKIFQDEESSFVGFILIPCNIHKKSE